MMNIIGGETTTGVLSQKWYDEVLSKRTKMLSDLPGIGVVTARKIVEEVEDIMGLCLLSEQELASIDGVSSIQAKELFKFLHG